MTARSALVLGGSALLVAASLAGSRLVSRSSDPFAGLPYGPRGEVPSEEERMEEGHAWEMFDWWYGQRAFPHALIPQDGFGRAWTQRASVPRDPDLAGRATSWTSMGPNNVGGRMLAIALDPGQPGHVWAGSASGGLWFSSVGGEGPNAWTRVETGHPALSVSSIVIDPTDTNRIWIGTGEISRYERPLVGTPGARASYGMGVLRTTDGGSTWSTTGLNWTFDQYRAVIAMKGSESDPDLLYAATSEGLYKTTDAGVTWANVHPLLMAMDVVIDPTNDSVVYVSHGQLGVPAAPDAGIYKTTNGGTTWTKLGGGLPTTDFGRTCLSITKDGSRLFAGVSDAVTRSVLGLYRTTNGGTTWSQVSNENWAGGQAWYDNAMAVSLASNDILVAAGLDCYRTTNGGANLSQVTFWWAGFDGAVPNGGPEGPSDYVHADSHAVVWDAFDGNLVWVACDGGIFKSTDAGASWHGANGGLVTTQFYAGFANGFTTQNLALGGLQDNGTVRYDGTTTWSKVYGGDGGWCAIDPTNENVMYEEYVYCDISKSTDGGNSWFGIHSGSSSSANFIAPFVICPSSPSTIYAGTLGFERSTNGGNTWSFTGGQSNWNGTPMATIGVSNLNASYVMAGTGNSLGGVEIRVSTNGGNTWTNVTPQLPDRYPTDFTWNPNSTSDLWATFSGYGTGHVFRSTDTGQTWADVTGNLPDIPHQTVAVDPEDADWAYVGTDLGVFRTTDGGATWMDFTGDMPVAMVLDLVIKLDDRRMRAATFGNGVWEIDLPAAATGVELAGLPESGLGLAAPRPNPSRGDASLAFVLPAAGPVRLAVYDAAGRRVATLIDGPRAAGRGEAIWDGRDANGSAVAAGVYFARLETPSGVRSAKISRLR